MFLRSRIHILLFVSVACLSSSTQRDASAEPATKEISFELDVQPILTRYGCNAGSCHGKQRGQNGFQLSLLGFDSDFDHEAIAKSARGRRIFPTAPDNSLLLQKAIAELPHGGGKRFEIDSQPYLLLKAWIEQGANRALTDEVKLTRIEVSPTTALLKPNEQSQLTVTAIYSDDSQRDVTSMAGYLSNESAIIGANESGILSAGKLPGETAIMVRYMNEITVVEAAIPQVSNIPAEFYAKLPRENAIDEHILAKLQSLGLKPSEQIDDAKFMRRVYTDIIGTIPTADQAKTFLDSDDTDKRKKLIDEMLQRPEYADHWAHKWADLLRPNPYRVGIKAVLNYDNWIRQKFRDNVPYDQFVREIISARGSTWQNGAVTFYRDRRTPEEMTTLASQLFLGVRLECARCHHHPFEKWSQDDFYQFAAMFAQVKFKGTGLSPPISGGEESVLDSIRGRVKHSLTDQEVDPALLFEVSAVPKDQVKHDNPELRRLLAEWVTSKENEYFAQVQVNRVWADLMGRGIVEPVDDLRATNPPTNEPLLAALADEFRAHDFDLKHLIRFICNSRSYSVSSIPNETNTGDYKNYSRHYRHRFRAEVLSSAVVQVTGTTFDYQAMPNGSRANQSWTHRIDSLFLDTFGRPDENQDPPCERTKESTVTQSLHLMNSPQLQDYIRKDSGVAAKLAASEKTDDELIEQLYLMSFSRYPTVQEFSFARMMFAKHKENRRQVVEDFVWGMMNSVEFVIQD